MTTFGHASVAAPATTVSNPATVRRRTCLGLALGLAADAAFPRAPDATGLVEETRPEGTYKTIRSFGGRPGRHPTGIMRASDGRLYGTTSGRAGAYDQGTVFCVDAHERVHVLHAFSKSPGDGRVAIGPPAEDDEGALYGLTVRGGAANGGVAWRLDRDGRWDIVHSFGVDLEVEGAGFGYGEQLLFASDGQFYGTTSIGGASGEGVVFRMGKDGTVTPLWSLGKPGDPMYPQCGLIEGADRRLYGCSFNGGKYLGGTIFSLAKDGSDRRVLYSFNADFWPAAALVQGTDGYLYGTTWEGRGRSNGAMFRIAPDGSDFTQLHRFWRTSAFYASPLLETEPGVFVGTTSGALYVLTADGHSTLLRRFGRRERHGVPDGSFARGPLCRLRTGEIVGTCSDGGATGGGTIWFARAEGG